LVALEAVREEGEPLDLLANPELLSQLPQGRLRLQLNHPSTAENPLILEGESIDLVCLSAADEMLLRVERAVGLDAEEIVQEGLQGNTDGLHQAPNKGDLSIGGQVVGELF
jgi:hypothetical protein